MKLEPKAKPVRIRIMSGGEEHYSLDSLKHNFSVQDLWEAVRGRSLARWLKQQNEIELAEKVDTFSQIEKLSVEDYLRFSGLFFEKEMGDYSFENANALVRFYRDYNMKNNFLNAFPFLLDSIDYQSLKKWFDSYRVLRNNEFWIAQFEAKSTRLQDEEEIECYQILSKLYLDNKDSTKMEYCLSKMKNLIIRLARKDKSIKDKWLTTGDFFYIKTLYEDEEINKTKSVYDWIAIFENCKNQLKTTQQAECYYFLYSLYKAIGDKNNADNCLEKSANLGCEEAGNELFGAKHSYPKLTGILNRYRSDNKRLALTDLDNISHDIITLEKDDEEDGYRYYRICQFGIRMLKEFRPSMFSIESLINVKISAFPEYESLLFLIGALSFESQYDSVELFNKFDEKIDEESPYKLIFKLKQSGQKETIVAEKGSQCDLKTASIVEQVVFFLETHGEYYIVL